MEVSVRFAGPSLEYRTGRAERSVGASTADPRPVAPPVTPSVLARASRLGGRLCMAVLILGCAPRSAGADDTFRAAIQQAMRDNPTISIDDQRQALAKAQMRGAIDAFMPTVAIVGERIIDSKIRYKPDIPVPTTGVDTTARREPNITGIQATLPLFDGFKRWNDLQATIKKVDAGRYLSVEARQQALLETITAYLTVVRDRGIVESRRRQVAAVSAIAGHTAVSFDTQDATRSEVATSRSRVEAARAALDQAQAALAASEIEYARIVGAKPGRMTPPPPPDVFLPRDVETLRRQLREESPRLAASRLNAQAARYEVKSAYADFAPRVDLQFTHGLQSGTAPGFDSTLDTTVKVVARVPIYTPGTFPRLEAARVASKRAEYQIVDTERRSLSSAEARFTERKGLISALERARKRLSTIREAVEARKIEQQAGFGTVIGRLDAESEAAEAAISVQNLSFEADRAGWEIAAALARIGDTPGATRIADAAAPRK